MVRIITIGKRMIKCPKCKSKLEYEANDIRYTPVHDVCGDPYRDRRVNMNILCPLCEVWIDVAGVERKLSLEKEQTGEDNG